MSTLHNNQSDEVIIYYSKSASIVGTIILFPVTAFGICLIYYDKNFLNKALKSSMDFDIWSHNLFVSKTSFQ